MTCPICAGAVGPFAVRDANVLVRCRGCGLVYMDPPPAREALTAMYADAYEGATTGYFTKIDAKLARSRRRVRRLARMLGATTGRAFLDVGSNAGAMVEAAREIGFVATGLEPDGAAIAWARRRFPANRYVHGLLEETSFGDERFDAVYCSEVIEHAPDCNRFAAALAALMAPGGLLFLTTPDIGHWRRPRDLDRWDAFCPPSHCVYFSPGNLTRLLARHGLTVEWRAWAFKPGIKLIARKIAPAEGP
jgi:SAM-dependent methyltransferase